MLGLIKKLFSESPKPAESIDASAETMIVKEASTNQTIKEFWLQAEATQRAGNLQEAYNLAEQALDLDPNNPELLMQLGALAFRLGRHEDAIDYLLTAIHLRTNFGEAFYELAVIYRKLNQHEKSIGYFEQAIICQPDNPKFICDLGLTKIEMDKTKEAITLYKQAIERKPDYAVAYNNLGHALMKQQKFREALEPVLIANALAPYKLEPLINLSKIYHGLNNIPAAHRVARRIINLCPDNHAALVFMFWYYALYGKFDKAWPIYHYRFSPTGGAEVIRRDFQFPEWEGQPLAGKSILVIAEQGLGDQIMFLSCLPDLLASSGKVVFECNIKLQELFQYAFPNVIFLGTQNKAEENVGEITGLNLDYQTHAGNLPVHFRPNLSSFNQVATYPYLSARPEKISAWKNRLSALPSTINIGISWRGGAEKTRSYLRSISLDHWQPILQLPNINFISLQYGECQVDCLTLSGGVLHHWPEMIADYQETAALLCNLDLVISVCTSVIHLAGALAVPTWVLVPSSPEWRYMIHGERMPWYPSVRLCRQAVEEDWSAVIARVYSDLIQKLSE